MTSERRRISSSSTSPRSWKEQRRIYGKHSSSYISAATVSWASLVIVCFLIGGTYIPQPETEQRRSSDDGLSRSSHDGVNAGDSSKESRDLSYQASQHFEVTEKPNKFVERKDSHEYHNVEKSSPSREFQVSHEVTVSAERLYLENIPGRGMEKASRIPSVVLVDSEEGEVGGVAASDNGKPQLDSTMEGDEFVPQRVHRKEVIKSGDSSEVERIQTEEQSTVEESAASSSWVAHEVVQGAPMRCASVEGMGMAASGDTRQASLRLRRAIRSYLADHGAERVRHLAPNFFCQRSFVLGKAQEDGFGNNIYKLLTAAGLGLILNRSLIIGESKSTNPAYISNSKRPLRRPFGDYVSYSDEAFSMREVKHLWADNDCSGKYKRPLIMQIDHFDSPAHSTALCEDWIAWDHPILMLKDAQDTSALQFLLKSQHANVRSAAAVVLGDPSQPDSRPNTFGELMMAIVHPAPIIRDAVDWTLKGGGNTEEAASADAVDRVASLEPPDIAVHLRMRNSHSRTGPEAASKCITSILNEMNELGAQKPPRIVVVSDTPSVVTFMKEKSSSLARSAHIISFDYKKFLNSSALITEWSLRENASTLPLAKRVKDWGPLPRWVAVVDFFLAARAKHAVVSGAHRRVATTYAQLLGSLAAANTLVEEEYGPGLQQQQPARLYSSFQESLLSEGLVSQVGWGHAWHAFGGKLSCPKQPPQCAITPLLPYAWWDAPWQSPSGRDRGKMKRWGILVEVNGTVTEESVRQFCRNKKRSAESVVLALPKARH